MKNPILILCFIAFSTSLFAQNPRIETLGDRRIETYKYLKGGDSISFTIIAKDDTLQTTDFYRNGHPQRKVWKRDSMYIFDELGRLKAIDLDLNLPSEEERRWKTFSNGQLTKQKSFKNDVLLEQSYGVNGQLVLTKRIVYSVDYTYKRWEDRNGVAISAVRTDTFRDGGSLKMFERDTAFWENGRPNSICNRRNEYEYMGCQYFDKTGKLVETTPANSLDLVTFKDNVDCYYGLKNKKGDTIVKPRFDRIENLDYDLWLAYTGKKAIILQRNGAPIATSFSELTETGALYQTIPYGVEENYSEKMDINKRSEVVRDLKRLYTFTDAGKYGVMNQKTEILMPPQYFPLSGRYVGDFKYFEFFDFFDKNRYTLKRSGFVNQQGNSLFPDHYKGVVYAYYDDYFFLSKLPYRRIAFCGQSEDGWRKHRVIAVGADENPNHNNTEGGTGVGVGKGDGTIILDAKYQSITHIDSSLFVVSMEKKGLGASNACNGIYNARTKKWLLDTTEFWVKHTEYQNRPYFIIEHIPTRKYGIMDTKGDYVLPLTYDSIAIVHYQINNAIILKKEDKYQLATITKGKITIQKEKYGHILPIVYNISSSNDFVVDGSVVFYLVKKNNKWGLLEKAGKVIKPFVYDYAHVTQDYDPNFLLVKNNQAEHYNLSSLPNEVGEYLNFSRYNRNPNPNEIRCFQVTDASKNVFFINNSGKVMIPPQYKKIYNPDAGELVFLQDAQKKKKFVFPSTGQLVDFPFDYNIEWASPKSSIMIVKDSGSISYGVVSTNGKSIVPCDNYSVAVGDIETAVFFIKKDKPIVKRNYTNFGLVIPSEDIDKDSLMVEDQNWLMFDKNGKTLSDKPFRFPIDFEKGVGIGMKDNDFSLYRTDGSALMVNGVQNFNNIRRDIGYERSALFYNQGLIPQLLLTKLNGEVLVGSGRYDGMSKFYGQYALVSKTGKIGLIDSLGKEIIAPQDLMASTQPLMDSLSAVNRLIYANRRTKNGYLYYSGDNFRKMPIDYSYYDKEYHPDSLNISLQQRAYVWNLMLQKALHLTMMTASDVKIQRADIKRNAEFVRFKYNGNSDEYLSPKRVVVSDTTIAFALTESKEYSFEGKYKARFYNFYRFNNRWEELQINDLLKIQGDKRWEMNDLITKKVKALKDEQIDCSNASAFITTVENRWMLTKEGIDFCFESTGGSGLVIISFTWAELAPFLKMKIF